MAEVTDLALAYAPRRLRNSLAALWALDDALERVVTTTTQPLIGQMRLAWWHEQLLGLDDGPIVAEPVLTALAPLVREQNITGADLAAMIDGWDVLLEPLPYSKDQLRVHASLRGDRLFDLSAQLLGSQVPGGMGAGWALVDFAMRCSDQTTRERAIELFELVPIKGPKPLRILAQLARSRAQQLNDQIMMPISRWALLRAVLS